MATIKDVARLAGVSITTVSQTISGNRPVSDATKSKVLQAMEKLNYQPNAIARSLVKRKTNIVGLSLPVGQRSFADQSFVILITEIVESLSDSGYKTLLLINRGFSMNDLIDVSRGGHVDGVLLLETRMSDQRFEVLRQNRVPFVSMGRCPACGDEDYVDLDNEGCIAESLNYLRNRGHKNVVLVNGPAELTCFHLREQALNATSRKFGPDFKGIAGNTDGTEPGAYKFLRELLMRDQSIDGVIASTEDIAVGSLKAISDCGREVGKDISVIVVGDAERAHSIDLRITTAHFDFRQFCRMAVDHLIDKITNPNREPVKQIVPVSIIERQSVVSFCKPGGLPCDSE